ncbi:MAG: hypothetical protein ACKO39_12775, partial [Chthoniobacterales bacterium]
LDTLPETARNAPAVDQVRKTLMRVEEEIKTGGGETPDTTRAARVGKIAAEFVAAAAAKQK